jgi:[ribosomal protein S18]-alanine N-acetyltransferase
LSFHIRKMVKEDIQQVSAIDREAFPTMWPPVNFQHELTNRLAHYLVAGEGKNTPDRSEIKLVARSEPAHSFLGLRVPFLFRARTEVISPPAKTETLTGFVGMWLMVDEAHIINIAVREVCRGKGIGELLLISSIELATALKASVVTLEVRVSNVIAQNLYTKYGFNQVGLRKKYYTDNNEDAYIMTTDIISLDSYQQRFQKLKQAHFEKLKDIDYQLPLLEPK